VIFAAQIKDCFDGLGRRLVGRVLWNGLLEHQPTSQLRSNEPFQR
jgi:hypothetical protein